MGAAAFEIRLPSCGEALTRLEFQREAVRYLVPSAGQLQTLCPGSQDVRISSDIFREKARLDGAAGWSRAQAGESCAHAGGAELFKAVILEASTPFSSSRQKKIKAPCLYTSRG